MGQQQLHIRNPHSVLAALETRPGDVVEITVQTSLSERGGSQTSEASPPDKDAWASVVQIARSHGIPIRAPTQLGPGRGPHKPSRDAREGRTGVTEAILKERPGLTAEELFRGAPDRAGGKGLWLALDSLTDPHNVGAIFRAASFFGVQGILLTQDRSAPLTSTVYDVASGGLEYVPFAVQTNLQRGFEVAKDSGLWILGSSERAKQSFRAVEPDRPWLLVLGSEEKGMRRLTEEACDVICAILPVAGRGVTSLNVSVAAGILISHLSAGGE